MPLRDQLGLRAIDDAQKAASDHHFFNGHMWVCDSRIAAVGLGIAQFAEGPSEEFTTPLSSLLGRRHIT